MQQPPREPVKAAYEHFPEYSYTLGPEVADLCDFVGFPPDEEQQLALDSLFGRTSEGLPTTFEWWMIAARQNLKTGFLKQACLGWLYVTQEELISWSAHELDTTREAFRDLTFLIENRPSLAKRLLPGPTNGIFRGSGLEAMKLAPTKRCPKGQRVKFKARTKGGARGLTGSKVILDEGFAVKPEHIGSIVPILSTKPEGQIVGGSSAGRSDSEYLREVRDRGRNKTSPRLGYVEYCAPDAEEACELGTKCTHERGTPGCAADNLDYLRMANTALERRITVQYIRDEREALPPAEFVRERLGWWDAPDLADAPLISKAMWRELIDPQSTPIDPVSFGIYVNKSQTQAAIGVAGYRPDGLYHVGIVPADRDEPGVASKTGTDWIPDRMLQLVTDWGPCAVVVDEKSEAGAIITDLQKLGIEVVTTNATRYAQACGKALSIVKGKEVRHRGARPLQDSVIAGKRRDLADAWAWDRKDPDSDITQLVAVTLALYGLVHYGQPPQTNVWGFLS